MLSASRTSGSVGLFSGIYTGIAGAGVVNVLFLDNHIIYALLLIGLAAIGAGKTFGFGERWAKLPLVKQYRWLG